MIYHLQTTEDHDIQVYSMQVFGYCINGVCYVRERVSLDNGIGIKIRFMNCLVDDAFYNCCSIWIGDRPNSTLLYFADTDNLHTVQV